MINVGEFVSRMTYESDYIAVQNFPAPRAQCRTAGFNCGSDSALDLDSCTRKKPS